MADEPEFEVRLQPVTVPRKAVERAAAAALPPATRLARSHDVAVARVLFGPAEPPAEPPGDR